MREYNSRVAKGRWKRRLGWSVIAIVTVAIILAATWRAWTPSAVKLALRARGVKVASVKWQGTNSWRFEGVERSRGGFLARAKSITILTPWAWKKALRAGDTNQIYVTVNGWRVILPQRDGSERKTRTNSIAKQVQQFNEGIRRLQQKCPRALILNGTLQTGKGEFNFGAVEWKNGELGGDFTWPQLNDPADFRLKIVDAAKLQLIVKQIALEVGVRATSEVLADGARLSGYARWKTNRVDFDATFAMNDNTPRNVIVKSKGLAIPGRFVGMPDVESLNAQMNLVMTNGQFDFTVGAPPAAESGSEAGGSEGH